MYPITYYQYKRIIIYYIMDSHIQINNFVINTIVINNQLWIKARDIC